MGNLAQSNFRFSWFRCLLCIIFSVLVIHQCESGIISNRLDDVRKSNASKSEVSSMGQSHQLKASLNDEEYIMQLGLKLPFWSAEAYCRTGFDKAMHLVSVTSKKEWVMLVNKFGSALDNSLSKGSLKNGTQLSHIWLGGQVQSLPTKNPNGRNMFSAHWLDGRPFSYSRLPTRELHRLQNSWSTGSTGCLVSTVTNNSDWSSLKQPCSKLLPFVCKASLTSLQFSKNNVPKSSLRSLQENKSQMGLVKSANLASGKFGTDSHLQHAISNNHQLRRLMNGNRFLGTSPDRLSHNAIIIVSSGTDNNRVPFFLPSPRRHFPFYPSYSLNRDDDVFRDSINHMMRLQAIMGMKKFNQKQRLSNKMDVEDESDSIAQRPQKTTPSPDSASPSKSFNWAHLMSNIFGVRHKLLSDSFAKPDSQMFMVPGSKQTGDSKLMHNSPIHSKRLDGQKKSYNNARFGAINKTNPLKNEQSVNSESSGKLNLGNEKSLNRTEVTSQGILKGNDTLTNKNQILVLKDTKDESNIWQNPSTERVNMSSIAAIPRNVSNQSSLIESDATKNTSHSADEATFSKILNVTEPKGNVQSQETDIHSSTFTDEPSKIGSSLDIQKDSQPNLPNATSVNQDEASTLSLANPSSVGISNQSLINTTSIHPSENPNKSASFKQLVSPKFESNSETSSQKFDSSIPENSTESQNSTDFTEELPVEKVRKNVRRAAGSGVQLSVDDKMFSNKFNSDDFITVAKLPKTKNEIKADSGVEARASTKAPEVFSNKPSKYLTTVASNNLITSVPKNDYDSYNAVLEASNNHLLKSINPNKTQNNFQDKMQPAVNGPSVIPSTTGKTIKFKRLKKVYKQPGNNENSQVNTATKTSIPNKIDTLGRRPTTMLDQPTVTPTHLETKKPKQVSAGIKNFQSTNNKNQNSKRQVKPKIAEHTQNSIVSNKPVAVSKNTKSESISWQNPITKTVNTTPVAGITERHQPSLLKAATTIQSPQSADGAIISKKATEAKPAADVNSAAFTDRPSQLGIGSDIQKLSQQQKPSSLVSASNNNVKAASISVLQDESEPLGSRPIDWRPPSIFKFHSYKTPEIKANTAGKLANPNAIENPHYHEFKEQNSRANHDTDNEDVIRQVPRFSPRNQLPVLYPSTFTFNSQPFFDEPSPVNERFLNQPVLFKSNEEPENLPWSNAHLFRNQRAMFRPTINWQPRLQNQFLHPTF